MNTSSRLGVIGRTLDDVESGGTQSTLERGHVGFAVDVHMEPIAEELHAIRPERVARDLSARRAGAATTSTITPPRLACRCAGASSASTRPSLSSATRWQRSASSRYGVARRIVSPLDEELRQELPELPARHRIHARRRLVEHEERRLVHERARQRQLLLHAARQPRRQPRCETARAR